MTAQPEYHIPVRHILPASVASLPLLVLTLLLASSASAQVGGAPPTGNAGFSGHSVTGAVPTAAVPVQPPTGAVRPPTGTVPNVSPSGSTGFPAGRFFSNQGEHRDRGHHHHRDNNNYNNYGPGMVYGVVPYAVDLGDSSDQAADQGDDNGNNDPDDQGGPTAFDRRGSGPDSYVPPVDEVPHAHADESPDPVAPDADPDPPEPSTTLVFKDGHTLDVSNYAIVGQTLFDLTPGHARKVPLASLNLDATVKQNDDHGVVFQLPAPAQAN
jgi:hypothetical protein